MLNASLCNLCEQRTTGEPETGHSGHESSCVSFLVLGNDLLVTILNLPYELASWGKSLAFLCQISAFCLHAIVAKTPQDVSQSPLFLHCHLVSSDAEQ